MGDTKRTREEKGKNKEAARRERDIERAMRAEEAPPEPPEDEEEEAAESFEDEEGER